MGLSNQAIADQEARETGDVPRTPQAVGLDARLALKAAKTSQDGDRDLLGVLEGERLERLQQAVETILRAEAQQGRCSACGRAHDPQIVLKAAQQLVRIAERRAALQGLDLKGKETSPPAAEDELARIRNRIHNEHPRQGGRTRGVKPR
jgi:hypothetical protein